MRIKLILFTILSLTTNSARSQTDDISRLMTRRYLSCLDIIYNVRFLIPEYHQKGATDTLNAIVQYWENNCGSSEELTRVKILLAIEQNSFSENIYNTSIIDHLIEYKNQNTTIPLLYGKMHHHYNWHFNFAASDSLKVFTKKLAKELLRTTNVEPIERFFLHFYSNGIDTAFNMMKTEALHGTHLRDLYLIEVNKLVNKPQAHIAYLAGAWIPEGNLALVGTHPFVGFRIGFKHRQLTTDVCLGFKFGKSPNQYKVFYKDSLWNTNHFFGGYIGLDAGYELIKTEKHGLAIIGGIAYNGFDALKDGNNDCEEDISKSINSLNLNLGIGYKYYPTHWNYFGVEAKYNYLNYQNPGGSDLSGNAITINLIYGFSSNRYAINRLRALNYNH